MWSRLIEQASLGSAHTPKSHHRVKCNKARPTMNSPALVPTRLMMSTTHQFERFLCKETEPNLWLMCLVWGRCLGLFANLLL